MTRDSESMLSIRASNAFNPCLALKRIYIRLSLLKKEKRGKYKAKNSQFARDSLLSRPNVMIKQFSPLRSSSSSITWSVYKNKLARLCTNAVKVQRFRVSLEQIRCGFCERLTELLALTAFLLVLNNDFRPSTELSKVDLPTFARPV